MAKKGTRKNKITKEREREGGGEREEKGKEGGIEGGREGGRR